MSWSYSGDPSTSELDQCRFWLQDIDTTYQLMQDEELLWLLSQSEPMQAAPLYAASVAAEVLANRYAKEVSVSADGVSVAVGDLQERFNKLAENLRAQWHEIVAALGDYDFAGHRDGRELVGRDDPAPGLRDRLHGQLPGRTAGLRLLLSGRLLEGTGCSRGWQQFSVCQGHQFGQGQEPEH